MSGTRSALPVLLLRAVKSFGWKKLIRNGRSFLRSRACPITSSIEYRALDLGFHASSTMVLGAGLEPACLSAYAPQTYVSAIPPPERFGKPEDGRWETQSRKRFCRTKSELKCFRVRVFPFGSFSPVHIFVLRFFFRHRIIEPCLRLGMS